jgi:putative PEP-CTERM system histidine kinase
LPIYNGTGGICYLKEGSDQNRNLSNRYEPVYSINIGEKLESLSEWENPDFFQKLGRDNWIFVPAATDPGLTKFNNLLPDTVANLDATLLILPLVNNDELIGFLTITADLEQAEDLDWEDLDLLRMVGKQVANFVGNQMLSSELVVTRQFEAFHQFTTFVMHDLKNLIAQQALVVENAGRFSDNPEFVADAISTIDNSVKKMSTLLLKINQNRAIILEETQSHPVSLSEAIESALVKCRVRDPKPLLHPINELMLVDADLDSLIMALTHLLTNAQEACEPDGSIDITLERTNGTAECKITDNGIGMEQQFIDNRLFKPFDSTKKNQGMGIGAYQCKQIISNIGGTISVSSNIGEGSCFTIILPLSNQPGVGNH